MTRASRIRGIVAAASLAIVGLAVPLSPTSADEGQQQDQAVTEQANPKCDAGERDLARAGDRFAQGCLSERQESQLRADEPEPELEAGEQASRKMGLLANIPKNGAFADEGSFSSDLAFRGDYAYAGNYNGFTVYDIRRPSQPQQVAQVVCPGSQNDVSVYRDLLVLSTDSSRTDDSCDSEALTAAAPSEQTWEGVKVFDISDPANPEYVSAVETKCGSHTHTLAPNKLGSRLFVYVSSYSPNEAFPDCQPPHDLISVVKVPLGDPGAASLVSEPVIFPKGGNPGSNGSSTTSGCHDITAYPKKDIAAGACMGDGVLMDISDRKNPVVTEQVRDTENFAFWHSATFNNAGTKVVFTDELGGGGAPTCNEETGDTKGANGIYDINQRGKLKFQSYYKMPRTQSSTELRGPQRLADPDQGPGRDGAGGVSGRDLGLRLHRLREPAGAGVVRPRRAGHRSTGARRLVVGLLLQRSRVLQRHPEGLRRPADQQPGRPEGLALPLRRAQPAEPAQLQRLT